MIEINLFREKLQNLIAKFDKDKAHYLSKGYPKAQVRLDFINPLFEAFGWDIENKSHTEWRTELAKDVHKRNPELVELSDTPYRTW